MSANFEDSRLPKRFWDKCVPEPNTGCWLWTASIKDAGYGQFNPANHPRRAHVVAYTALVGAVPNGLELDHKCRVRSCVNPAHLEPVTRRENMLRSAPAQEVSRALADAQKTKTHCPKGHPYDEDNAYFHQGRRHCKACGKAQQQKRRAT